MQEKFEDIIDFVLDHYPSIIGAIAIIITGILAITSANTVADYTSKEPDLRAQIEQVKVELDKESTAEADTEAVKESTINARDIGTEIVKAQTTLASVYATHEAPSDEGITKAKSALDVLAKDIDGEALSNMWVRNSDWTLELKSVVNYKGVTSMPVIFTMTTNSGDLAGLVRATYDSDVKQLTNVKAQYTAAGKADFAEVGGE